MCVVHEKLILALGRDAFADKLFSVYQVLTLYTVVSILENWYVVVVALCVPMPRLLRRGSTRDKAIFSNSFLFLLEVKAFLIVIYLLLEQNWWTCELCLQAMIIGKSPDKNLSNCRDFKMWLKISRKVSSKIFEIFRQNSTLNLHVVNLHCKIFEFLWQKS